MLARPEADWPMIWLNVYSDWQLISLCGRVRQDRPRMCAQGIHNGTYVVVSSAIKLRTRDEWPETEGGSVYDLHADHGKQQAISVQEVEHLWWIVSYWHKERRKGG